MARGEAVPFRRGALGRTIAAGLLTVLMTGQGAGETAYRARLSPVAMDLMNRADVAGLGEAHAILQGNTLRVTGSFGGLSSPATGAQLSLGELSGVRGGKIYDLQATAAASGTITGAVSLTPAQVAALRQGRIYVQINSQRARDGNLWGWLWPADGHLAS